MYKDDEYLHAVYTCIALSDVETMVRFPPAYVIPLMPNHNELILALIEAINSDLDYKLAKIDSPYGYYFSDSQVNCYTRMCKRTYRFLLREEDIVILHVAQNDHETMVECVKVRLFGDSTDNDIYMAKGYFKLQEFLDKTDKDEDLLLSKLAEIVSNSIDCENCGHSIKVLDVNNTYYINFAIKYPKYTNKSNSRHITCRHRERCDKIWHQKEQARRLLCIQYGKAESKENSSAITKSVSYDIEDPKILNKIIRWLNAKKFSH